MLKRNFLYIFISVFVFAVLVNSFLNKQTEKQVVSQVVPTSSPEIQVLGVQIGNRNKTSDCVTLGALPDSNCTPGAIFTDVTAKEICVPGYSKSVRNVSEKIKNEVYSEYGITTRAVGEYEVDHLVPLELGGNNDIANLWPEAADPRPGFHEKDKIENYLHQLVCNGELTLERAQNIIATDWQKVVLPVK
jgi:hypothetical protein